MTAEEKFKIGMQVAAVPGTWTYQVPRKGIITPNNTGTVRGFGRDHISVRVQRSGQKIMQTYGMDTWEPIP